MSSFSRAGALAFLFSDESSDAEDCEVATATATTATAAAAVVVSPSALDSRVQRLMGGGASSPPLVVIDSIRTSAECLPPTPTASPFRPDTPTARARSADGPQELQRHTAPMEARTIAIHGELYRERAVVGEDTPAGVAMTHAMSHLCNMGGFLGYAKKTTSYLNDVSHSNLELHAEVSRLRERDECSRMQQDMGADWAIEGLRQKLAAANEAHKKLKEQHEDLRAIVTKSDGNFYGLLPGIVSRRTGTRKRSRSRERERARDTRPVHIGADGRAPAHLVSAHKRAQKAEAEARARGRAQGPTRGRPIL